MNQLVQISGAILILAGYLLGTTGRLDINSRSYLLINLIGSALLAGVALLDRQWGFLILNSAWSIISVINLLRTRRGPTQ